MYLKSEIQLSDYHVIIEGDHMGLEGVFSQEFLKILLRAWVR